ncbi:MAG TPA: hypothetical protein PLY45_04970 [bacterium]|nr:hypothetical protein [bacterium]
MKSRLTVALCAVFLLAGCAALDTDNTPIEGMQPGDPVPGLALPGMGPLTGYYSGTMTLESNTCNSVSDQVGDKIELAFDIAHQAPFIQAVFSDGLTVSGMIEATKEGDSVTMVVKESGVEHIYYLLFTTEKLVGSVEVAEQQEDGNFGESCASYQLDLAKGVKPVEVAEGGGEAEAE